MFLTENEACFLTTNDVFFNNERNKSNECFSCDFYHQMKCFLTTKEVKEVLTCLFINCE